MMKYFEANCKTIFFGSLSTTQWLSNWDDSLKKLVAILQYRSAFVGNLMNFVTWVVSQAWIIILTSARISSEYITPS